MGIAGCPEWAGRFTGWGILSDSSLSLMLLVWLGKRQPPEVRAMQVLCKKTNGNAESRCCVCGEGFVLFWERESRAERLEAKAILQEMLRRHHRVFKGPEAHPQGAFVVPSWSRSYSLSMRGSAPAWEL
jgi:hypothetical protein